MLSTTLDPLNRPVASELERRWDEALLKVARLEEELQAIVVEDPVSDEEGSSVAGARSRPCRSMGQPSHFA